MKKTLLIASIFTLITVVFAGVFFASIYVRATLPFNLEIDIDNLHNEITGFGASSAWITQNLGALADEATQEEAIEALYGQSGMQLSVYRYNIGGGSIELGDKISYSDNERATESFFITENYVDLSSFSNEDNYDFTKDINSINMLLKAVDKGCIKKIVLFANSPHYLMTESKLTHGAYEYQNNLPKESYLAYADYLVIISKNIYNTYLKDKGIDLYVSPINEPQWRWGGDAIQEGCHYDPKNLNDTMSTFYDRLCVMNEKNYSNIKLEAFDSGSYLKKHNDQYFKEIANSQWFKDLESIAVHSYHKSKSISHKKTYSNYSKNELNKNIVMTEFCVMSPGRDYSMESALYMSKVIIRDLIFLNANEWGWWLGLSALDYNDGLVYWDYDKKTTKSKISYTKRYYCMAQFSKYLEPGDVRIDLKLNGNISYLTGLDVAAFLKPNGDITLVTVNSSNKNYKINLGNYEVSQSIITNDKESLKVTNTIGSNIKIEPQSVTTFFIAG